MTVAKEDTTPKEAQFDKKLKKVCSKCSAASIKVYKRNITRLWRLVDDDAPLPLTGSWLKKPKLLAEYKKLPLKSRRHISTAAVKAAQMYKVTTDRWSVQMYKDAALYQRGRDKNTKTPVEKKKWPTGGFKAVKKAASQMWQRVKVLLKGEPTMKALYRYQMFILLKLFSELPFRNTFATFELNKQGNNNYIEQPKRGNIRLVVRQHKAVKTVGPRTVTLSRAASMALRKFLKFREKVVDNKWLFNTMTKGKMSRATLGKALHRVTKELLGSSFGSRLIRVLAATAARKEIEKVQELGYAMLHSGGSKQTAQYSRKD